MVRLGTLGGMVAVAALAACQSPAADAGTRAMAAASPGASASAPPVVAPSPAAPVAAPTLTPEQATLSVASGEAFTVVVKGIPTTGYVWHLAAGYDAAVVTARGSRVLERPRTEPPLLGAPTVEVFDFTGGGAGRTTLVLKLYRPWEGEASTVETRRVEVVVR